MDGLLRRASERRRKSIEKSMMRPMRLGAFGTTYIIVSVPADFILVPSVVFSVLSRPLAFAGLVVIMPIAYVEWNIHGRWFSMSRCDEKLTDDRSDSQSEAR